jgi:hypothetical protein
MWVQAFQHMQSIFLGISPFCKRGMTSEINIVGSYEKEEGLTWRTCPAGVHIDPILLKQPAQPKQTVYQGEICKFLAIKQVTMDNLGAQALVANVVAHLIEGPAL